MIRSAFTRKIALAVSLMAGLALWTPQALAQAKCELTMMPTPTQWVIRSDPNGNPQFQGTFNIVMTNNGQTPCNGAITAVSTGNVRVLEGRVGGSTVPFSLRDVGSRSDITPGTAENLTGVERQIRNGKPYTASVLVTVTPADGTPAGRYTRDITLQFLMPNGDVHGQAGVTLVYEIEPSVMIGLAGEFRRDGSVAVINLGELTEPGTVPLNAKVYVRATTGYLMTVTSENRGQLKHTTPGWSIPYGLSLGGREVNLTTPQIISNRDLRARTDDYPIRLNVRDLEGKRAGRYSDVLNFTITAI